MDLTNTVEKAGSEEMPFGPETEVAIVSLIFDYPEFFTSIGQHFTHKFFHKAEAKYVIGIVEELYEKFGSVPPRSVVRDEAFKKLTVEDDYEPIVELINRASDPRELPFVKKEIINWARDQAYGLIYSDEGMTAYEMGDYDRLEEIFEQAKRITDVSDNGMFFFKESEMLFVKDLETRYTTGFSRLDQWLNEGGPTKGEVVCYMAGTGVGKSILLPHSGMANVKRGCNVLHVTLELSKVKTALRYAGGLSNVEVAHRYDPEPRRKMTSAIEKAEKSYRGDLAIYEFSPNEISIAHISQLIDQLRKNKGWNTDVLVIDYLELMLATRPSDNAKEYHRQKQVATELRQLARNEKILVFTATQMNRDDPKSKNGPGPQVASLNRVSESYGKMMPMDYVISANQEFDEYNTDQPQIRLFVAKNRNGPKNKKLTVAINYRSFHMEEKRINKPMGK